VFATTVGQKPSRAPYYVNDAFEVEELLHAVVSLHAKPMKRAFSLPCLNNSNQNLDALNQDC
jgi:hypothetical protein